MDSDSDTPYHYTASYNPPNAGGGAYSDHYTVGGGRCSDQVTMVGRNSDQLTMVGRNSDQYTVDNTTYYDNSTLTTNTQTNVYSTNGYSYMEDSSIIDSGYPDQSAFIGRSAASTIATKSQYTNDGKKKGGKKKKETALSKITASRQKTTSSKTVKTSKTSKTKLTVKAVTKKQQKYKLASDRTTVTVKTNPKAKKKVGVITIRRDLSDLEDPLASDINEFCGSLRDGPLSFRFLTCVGALFMVISNIVDYTDEAYYDSVSLFYTGISAYIWVFSVFVITLDIRPFHCRPFWIHRFILHFVKVLRFSWGRGFLYFFSGSLQLCLATLWNMIAGGTMMLIGLITVYIGQQANSKMRVFITRIGARDRIDIIFNKYDLDHDGYLNPEEFGQITADMDIPLSYDEFVAIFTSMDRNHDRYITREDIGVWFKKYKARQKKETAFTLPLV